LLPFLFLFRFTRINSASVVTRVILFPWSTTFLLKLRYVNHVFHWMHVIMIRFLRLETFSCFSSSLCFLFLGNYLRDVNFFVFNGLYRLDGIRILELNNL